MKIFSYKQQNNENEMSAFHFKSCKLTKKNRILFKYFAGVLKTLRNIVEEHFLTQSPVYEHVRRKHRVDTSTSWCTVLGDGMYINYINELYEARKECYRYTYIFLFMIY